MPDQTPQTTGAVSDAEPTGSTRLGLIVAKLRSAMIAHKKRAIALLVTGLLLMAGIGAAWSYMLDLAIKHERQKLDDALVALDTGDYEEARSIVRHLLNMGAVPRSDHGTPLFVLGAVKTFDAGSDLIPAQRRTQYLVASRYLSEARSYGFPPHREKQGLLLLGKSLVETLQTDQAIEVLTEALAVEPVGGGQLNVAIHRLLAEASTLLPKPNHEIALKHLQAVLSDPSLLPDQEVAALLMEAKFLGHLRRYDDALQSLAKVPATAQRKPEVLMTHGQILLDRVAAARDRLPLRQDGSLSPELDAHLDQARRLLLEAQELDQHATEVTRRTQWLLGRGAELRGDEREALKHYARTHQQYSDTPEGLAATLAEADILRRAGDNHTALIWYRQVLQGEVDPLTYRSEVLSIEQLRMRILQAVSDFTRNGLFASAVTMLANFTPLFARTQELELRGKILRDWGEHELIQASDQSRNSPELRSTGLRHLREGGVAYEQLATLRFATSNYPKDLWNSADCFYLGHSYSSAARLLELYLQHEPETQNSQSLLRLGQANLALGRIDESIAALEECIELYSRDNATYQARIDCAKAHWYRGNTAEAERLMRFNLSGSMLEPQSPEWKDSLFALGLLLFDQGRYEQAISTLEEAVERYPLDRQTLQARYVIGEAYRRWASEPLERLESARTASDRDKNQQLVQQRLTLALQQFKGVQSSITLKVQNVQEDSHYAAMRRNCYMLEGACLFDLGRYQEAIEAYQNVSSLYPNEPFVLETFVQIAHCWQRLDRAENARGAIEQAQLTLRQLPNDADFAATTAFSREEWRMLLRNMSQW